MCAHPSLLLTRLIHNTNLFCSQAIHSGDRSKLIVTPEAAALTIELIEAATRSAKEGRTIEL